MTHGRPSMTTHLAPLPPAGDSDISRQYGAEEPSLMAFYTEAIKLYDILDRILSDVYYAWRGRSRQDQLQPPTKSLGSLDTVLDIERQLTLFEANLPPFLKWSWGPSLHPARELNQAIARQRNVLQARYIRLIILLLASSYLPIQISASPSSPPPSYLYPALLGNSTKARICQRGQLRRSYLPKLRGSKHPLLLYG